MHVLSPFEMKPDLEGAVKLKDAESAPDILAVSSEIIVSIISAYADGELPPFVHPLTLDNYFSERVTGRYAIKTICNAWKTSQDSFEISVIPV